MKNCNRKKERNIHRRRRKRENNNWKRTEQNEKKKRGKKKKSNNSPETDCWWNACKTHLHPSWLMVVYEGSCLLLGCFEPGDEVTK